MAADFIKIDRQNPGASPFATELIDAVAAVRTAYTAVKKVQAKGFRMFTGADFAVFQTLYGIPTGSGQVVFDLINGTALAMEGGGTNANSQELINRVG